MPASRADPSLEAIGDFTQEGGADGDGAGCSPPAPTSTRVFAASDLMAAGALAVLDRRRSPRPGRRRGRRLRRLARRDHRPRPQLTSVRQPIEEMGHEMARLLVDAVEGSDPVPRRVILATELVRRASSAGRRVALSRPATGGRRGPPAPGSPHHPAPVEVGDRRDLARGGDTSDATVSIQARAR